MGEFDLHKAIRSRSFGGVKVSIMGDLNTLNHFMGLDGKISKAITQAQNKFMVKYKRALIKNFIEGGASIGILQNEDRYLKRKLARGYDGLPGNLTHSLRESITIMKKGNVSFVGIPRGTHRVHSYGGIKNGGYTVDEYAELLENGSTRQPARPFFSNTFRMTMGGSKDLGLFIRRSIAQRLRLL